MEQPQVTVIVRDDDSSAYNVVQGIQSLGAVVRIVPSDADAVELTRRPMSHLILSPGTGHPRDSGLMLEAVRNLSGRVPILGICLGHQAIGHVLGTVIYQATPVHGKTSTVYHNGQGVFIGLPNPLSVMRYNSLLVEPLPAAFITTAWTPAGEVMALQSIRHRTVVGVQFHPDSFWTQNGPELLENFLALK